MATRKIGDLVCSLSAERCRLSNDKEEFDIQAPNSLWESKTLFGGAIVCSLPASFKDISRIRQVPDQQEVYVEKDTDISIIFELISYTDTIADGKAGEYYFQDLAQQNEASKYYIEASEVLTNILQPPEGKEISQYLPNVPNKYPRCLLIGKQLVNKQYPNKYEIF
jgi:hypothetical protein